MDVSRHMGTAQIASLLETMLAPKKGERLLFLTDYQQGGMDAKREWRMRLLLRWHAAARLLEAKRGIRLLPIVKYLQTGSNNSDLPATAVTQDGGYVDDLAAFIASANIVVAMNEFSASAPLKNIANRGSEWQAAPGRAIASGAHAAPGRIANLAPALRVVSMPGVTVEMEGAMSADYAKIAARGKKLAAVLSGASSMEMTFDGSGVPRGTGLSIDVRAGGWIVDAGECHNAGDFINFPSGEVFAPPYEGTTPEGRSIFGDSKTEGMMPVYSRHDAKVAFLKVEKNRIVRVQGDSLEADSIIDDISKDENNANIAEIGLGINSLARCGEGVPVLESEKAGVHIAYGRNDHFGAPSTHSGKVKASLHRDIVFAKESPIRATAYAVYPNGRRILIAEQGKVVAV